MQRAFKNISSVFSTYAVTICISLALLIIVLVLYKNNEKYTEGFGQMYDTENAFSQRQNKIFWNKMNKELDYNSGLDKEMRMSFKEAVKNIDPMTSATAKNNLDDFFRKDPLPSIQQKGLNCSTIKKPSLLPKRTLNTVSGCGWWYVDDDTKSSFAENGTKLGPLANLKAKAPSGKWIWDLDEAQKLEDVKRCRKIKSCEIADLLPKECGFCSSTGGGLPIDNKGNAKYPEDNTLICPETIVVNPKRCPKPIPIPIVTADGKVAFNNIKQSICDPVNGKLTIECLISLAKAVGFNEDGAIMTVLNNDSLGYYKGSEIPRFIFRTAIDTLEKDAKIKTISAFLGDGVCTREDALNYYKAVNEVIASGRTIKVKEAAAFLVLGTEFDPCRYESDQVGPFELYCLEHLAREKGCQPDGTEFPRVITQQVVLPSCKNLGRSNKDGSLRVYTNIECGKLAGIYNSNTGECLKRTGGSFSRDCNALNVQPEKGGTKSKYDKMKWREVSDYFRSIHDDLGSTNQTLLEEASMKCLGIKVKRKAPDCSEVQGCEVLWYNWQYEWDFPEREISNQVFYGREIKSNLPSFNTANSDYNPYNILNTMSFKLRTYLKRDNPQLSKIWVMSDDGVVIKVDDTVLLKKWTDQGPTAYQTKAFLIHNTKPVKIEAYWYKNYGNGTFMPKLMNDVGEYGIINTSDLTIRAPALFPLSRWDLYNGVQKDRNDVLMSSLSGQTGEFAGRKCMKMLNREGIAISNKIRGGAFNSYTFMVYNNGGWARLFALRSGTFKTGPWTGASIEGGISADSKIWFAMQREGGLIELWVSTQPNTIKKKEWSHIAFCIDDDFRGVTIYANGKAVGAKRNEDLNGERYKENIFNNNTIAHSNWIKNPPITPPPSKTKSPNSTSGYQYKTCIGATGQQIKGDFAGEANSPGDCFKLAKSKGSSFFGLHQFGQCFVGTSSIWTTFPALASSTCGPLGKDGFTQIYSVGPLMIPECPPAIDGSLDIGLAWAHFFDYKLSDDDVYADRTLGFNDEKIYSEDASSGWKHI